MDTALSSFLKVHEDVCTIAESSVIPVSAIINLDTTIYLLAIMARKQ